MLGVTAPSKRLRTICPFLARLIANDKWQFGKYGKQNVGNWIGEPGVVYALFTGCLVGTGMPFILLYQPHCTTSFKQISG